MTTVDYIPFITTEYDCQTASQLYSDAFAMRVGGAVVEVSAPNPVWVEGLPGMPAYTIVGSAKFG